MPGAYQAYTKKVMAKNVQTAVNMYIPKDPNLCYFLGLYKTHVLYAFVALVIVLPGVME